MSDKEAITTLNKDECMCIILYPLTGNSNPKCVDRYQKCNRCC